MKNASGFMAGIVVTGIIFSLVATAILILVQYVKWCWQLGG